MNPLDEDWRDDEMVKLFDHPVVLNCVEGRAEVDKKVNLPGLTPARMVFSVFLGRSFLNI